MGTPTSPAGFAHLLRRYRLAAGLTQEELAERARLSARGISNLERGIRRLPQRGTVALLITALDLHGAESAVFAAAARGLSELPSADHPALPVPNNLPLALTSFVGRERELSTVQHLLGRTHLLTLTGAGGCGKSRLALEAAHALAREPQPEAVYADGIRLVELAPLSDGALVLHTVATVLGVREQPGRLLLDSLTAFLRPKQMLLLLDNCEHLVTDCAVLADALLRECPRLTILATSREALGIGGERRRRVPSLSLPNPRGPVTLEQILACEAVQLFVQRAQLVRPALTLIGPQVDLVGRICARLDGIPLAIELAAARLSAISLDQLAARLDDRFHLLIGGSRTALPRQQTLRATLDWSYDLLVEPERALLRRLSVFADGWTLEAAEVICAGEAIASGAVLDLLAGLVNKSLVLLDEGRPGVRYRLLETVRQYGREKLAAGEAPRLQDRNLEWYLALAGQAAQRIGGTEREMWLDRLEGELENLRTALHWSSMAEGRQQVGLQLAAALEDFWYIRGYAGEGRQWLERLLERAGTDMPTALRARSLGVLALLTYYRGEYAQAIQLFEAAHILHVGEGNVGSATWMLNYQGMVSARLGEYRRADTLLEQALRAHREQGDLHGVGWALCYMASIRHLNGAYTQAAALHAESLAVFEELGDKLGIGHELAFLGHVVRDQGDYGQAKRLYCESLRVRRALMDKHGVSESFEGLAIVAAAEGQPIRGARLFGTAHGLREGIGTPMDLVIRAAHDRALADVRTALGADAFTAAWTTGQAMTLEEATADALEDDARGGLLPCAGR